MIELRVLGTVSVLRDETRVRLETQKQYALLVYLALNQGRIVRRDELTALLWEGSTRSRGRHSLSQALYGIRRRIPELSFQAGTDELWLESNSICVDVLEVEALLADGDLDRAVALYSGPFLDGFWLRHAAAFEEWQETKRGNVDRSIRDALRHLVQRAEQGGGWKEVERFALHLLELDPLDEDVHRIRIEAIAASGERARALFEYDEACRTISKELGRDLSPELVALRTQIADSRELTEEEDQLHGADEVALPFIGRADEFKWLREQWAEVKAGQGRAVVVSGEAGIGKSRLCRHFQRLAALHGARILSGRCYSSERQLPYSGAVDALVGGLQPDDIAALPRGWAAVVSELLPELYSALPEFAGTPAQERQEGARRRLFEGVARLLEKTSARAPVVLFIDDFQWADESTIALAHYLGRRLANHPIFILLALRPDEVSTQSGLRAMIDSREEAGGFQYLNLSELSTDAAEQLISHYEAQEGLTLPNGIRMQILSQAGGQPFFILETLKAIKNREIPDANLNIRVQLEPPLVVLLPRSIEEFLMQRFEALRPTTVQALGALAVLGKGLKLEIAQEVSGLEMELFIQGIEELATRGFVRELSGEVSFSHDLICEAAYRYLSGVRRRVLHGRAATILKRIDGQAGTLAVHFDLAGDRNAAFEYALLAASASERIYAYNETEFFLRMALANAQCAADRFEVQERLADFLYHHRRFSEAEKFFATLENQYKEAGNARGLLAIEMNRTCIWMKQGAVPGIDLLNRFDQLADSAEQIGAQPELSIILSYCAGLSYDMGQADIAVSTAERLVKLGRSAASTNTRVRALTSAAKIMGLYKTVGEGIAHSNEAVDSAVDAGENGGLIAALVARATNYIQAGLLKEAERDFERALELAERLALFEYRHSLLNNFGVLNQEKGDFKRAEMLYAQVADLATQASAHHEMLFVSGNLALLNFEAGRLDRAEKHAQELLSSKEEMAAWLGSCLAYGILGLCALDRRRFTDANLYRRDMLLLMADRTLLAGDISYPEMFMARLTALEGEATRAIERLDGCIAAYEHRDVFCRSRLQLERARLLVDIDREQARRAASEVRDRAAGMGARPLVERADAILDRIRFRT